MNVTLAATEALNERAIGILGGTFDPIHCGHLRSAVEVREGLKLEQVRLLPCGIPPHRGTTAASAGQRLEMVKAAIGAVPGLVADDREVRRPGPSYMVDTLESLRAEFEQRPLCLIMGTDAYAGLAHWNRWQRLLELAHIIVCRRPGEGLPANGVAGGLLRERACEPSDLHQHSCGRILAYDVTQLDIAASRIRALIAAGGTPHFLLPESALEVINRLGLYGRSRASPNQIPYE